MQRVTFLFVQWSNMNSYFRLCYQNLMKAYRNALLHLAHHKVWTIFILEDNMNDKTETDRQLRFGDLVCSTRDYRWGRTERKRYLVFISWVVFEYVFFWHFFSNFHVGGDCNLFSGKWWWVCFLFLRIPHHFFHWVL